MSLLLDKHFLLQNRKTTHKTNAGKCHLLTSSKTPVDIHISNTEILNEERVKLVGVNLEGRLNFDFHGNTLLKKASKKYHALARVCHYMNKKKCLFSWILSQHLRFPTALLFRVTSTPGSSCKWITRLEKTPGKSNKMKKLWENSRKFFFYSIFLTRITSNILHRFFR